METAFARPIATVLSHFGVDEHNGLDDKKVEELRKKYGRNGILHFLSPSLRLVGAAAPPRLQALSIASNVWPFAPPMYPHADQD